jgi:hypothetical protein
MTDRSLVNNAMISVEDLSDHEEHHSDDSDHSLDSFRLHKELHFTKFGKGKINLI